MSYVTIENLSVCYGDTPALTDINLSIAEGELITLVGPSGCGKSSLLRVLAGLLQPQQGRIVLADVDISALAPEKRQIGWVPQHYALFEHLNVFDNIAFGLRTRGLKMKACQQQVEKMLELCHISDLAKRPVRQLSGGQRQRVAVARALAIEPRVLLLDEPLAALDPQLRHDLRHSLKQLIQNSGVTTLFVTHDQSEALSLADRVVLLHQGKVAQFASPQSLWHQPASDFVAQFFGSATIIQSKRIQNAKGDGGVLELLSELTIPYAGEDEPRIVLRDDDLCSSDTGLAVRVQSAEYLGNAYTYRAETAQGQPLTFTSRQFFADGTAVHVQLCADYRPTIIQP